jgi:hypothetical protein
MSKETKAEGSALATAHVPNTTSTETTTFSSATRNSPPNPAQRRIMVRAKLLQFLLCKGDFSEYFVQHIALLLGLDRMSPLMTTCSHMYRENMVLFWAPKKWTHGVRKVMRRVLFMSPRWKTWVWTLKVEHMVLGVGSNSWGDEANVVRDDWIRFVAGSGKFPRLTSINLRRCYKITDAGLSDLARGCPQLTSIDLGFCDKITDTGRNALRQGCPQLKW